MCSMSISTSLTQGVMFCTRLNHVAKMRIISSVTSSTLFLALIIASRADSDESDESGERNTKIFDRITSLLYRSTKNHGHHQDGPGSLMQPYPYLYMGFPYYIGTNAGPYMPAEYQRTPPQGYPSVAYSAPQPTPGASTFNVAQLPNNANPNYSLYPNYPAYPSVPTYNPYPSIPTQAYSSDKKHHHRHSS
ncbi:PREDICTED: uncharacterized protein LOC108374454 isoform X1 [Rhagoletis zephyria]|uniref:uncharacterized protein LOC108374454 isoform X1 n=1 Tax=Rhagoletis zephyria TaxID=28612 RepID=UPI00081138F0|nr:PREDICTED: uncharacterized protein LOC108374454 isoform X1 [Rhagoletis zephyria]